MVELATIDGGTPSSGSSEALAGRKNSGTNAGRPLRVVHLVLTLNIGGLEKVVYDLVRSSDRERLDMRVLCLGEIGGLGPSFEALGVTVESLGVHHLGPVQSVLRVARRLREMRPDVLHTHNAAPHLVGALAARLARVPVVVQTRHGRHQVKGWTSRLVNSLATRLTDAVVAVSHDAAEVARASDHVPERKLEVIWNGIDLAVSPRPERSAVSTGARVIHVARFDDAIKDQSTLLRAARIVADAVPEFVLELVGDGPSRATLESLCDELRLRRHVNFPGYRHDIDKMLRGADLFVLSSVTEGLSISLLEAMAAGLPVVATDVGGNGEVVVAEETGLLVPSRSPEKLAAAMLELLRDPQRSRRMGAAGRRRVEEHFDLRKVAARYEQIYRTLTHA